MTDIKVVDVWRRGWYMGAMCSAVSLPTEVYSEAQQGHKGG